MITKVKTAENYGPKRSYFFPVDDRDESIPMTPQIRRTLIDLIYQTMEKEGRERLLAQLSEMTQAEAKEMIFDIRTANWR